MMVRVDDRIERFCCIALIIVITFIVIIFVRILLVAELDVQMIELIDVSGQVDCSAQTTD